MVEFNQLIEDNIHAYIDMLVKDFDENLPHAEAFNEVFLNGYSIKKLIKQDKKIFSFYDWDFNVPLPYDPLINGIQKIEDQNLNFEILSKFPIENLYYFFDKRIYNSEIEAISNFPTEYFFIDFDNFKKKLDDLFLNFFSDYDCSKKKFKKKINEKFSFVLSPRKISSNSLIENYIFPEFYVENNTGFSIVIENTDVLNLLFMPSYSFHQFYSYYNKFLINENHQIISVRRLNDEPHIYHDNLSNKYIISNHEEKIKNFNTFIFLSLELTVHYMKIFEQWLAKVINGI
ncbi:hypothetical protein [Ferruginibacter albus]|uniref:hypothetical protein n=1 Tax=Ferruginibacter albus TaxID=2875540 RepID=UPI001CC48E17|nr:hypothetical protein [Ferruginibacter albus]UAY53251.1 hypothetical protein K9M53_06160 [Ferruginibacter albus]